MVAEIEIDDLGKSKKSQADTAEQSDLAKGQIGMMRGRGILGKRIFRSKGEFQKAED